MVPVYDITISYKALREINDRINAMFDWFYDAYEIEGIEGISCLFPEHLLIEKPDWCVKKFHQLRGIVKDNFLRDSIEPIYEYILYHVIQYEIEYLKEEDRLRNFDFLLFDENGNELDDIPEEYYVNNIEGYINIIFQDIDFITVAEGYLISELDEYMDLMPEDIRNKVTKSLNEERNNIESIVIKNFQNAILQIEEQPMLYFGCTEPQLNDHMLAIVKQSLFDKKIIVEREKLQGFSLKKSGEADFYLYDKSSAENIAIGESKNADLFLKTLQQLFGYITRNTKFGFTISINKNLDILNLKNKIINILNEFNNKDFAVEKIYQNYDYIVSVHKIPEEQNKNFVIYHLILNLNNNSRKQIAKQARI